MGSSIGYDKAIRSRAHQQDKVVFAVGWAPPRGGNRSEVFCAMNYLMADALFAFCDLVRCGKPPAEAFAAIAWPAPAEPKGAADV